VTNRDLWNARYSEKGELWGAEPNRFVAEWLAGLTPRRVLDLGAGQGRNAIWLAGQGHGVTAVDISDVAVEQGRRMAALADVRVDFIAADLEHWRSEPNTFDLVVLSYLQLPSPIRTKVHRNVVDLLVSGGEVFLIGHHIDNIEHGVGGPQNPEMLFSENDLASDFRTLEILENRKVLRPVASEGVVADAIDVLFRARK
jgi:SAM-dependent methyltransferase